VERPARIELERGRERCASPVEEACRQAGTETAWFQKVRARIAEAAEPDTREIANEVSVPP